MATSRFVIGIDLGTTNTALAFTDTGQGGEPAPQPFPVPQLVQAGAVADRSLLPSFLYLPLPNEQPAGSLKLPWDPHRDYAVGTFARDFGAQVPTRLVASAKSWLCHAAVDRRAPLLPWRAPEGGRKVSPLEASTRYLRHLAEAWNAQFAQDLPDHRLERQDIVLTVPASFDAAARELTVEAARAAGLDQVTLLEEPQAAFYAWLDAGRDAWRQQVAVGDLILVCDVGGGTTDFTLIGAAADQGQLVLNRLAVGEHILLGGDNMDLALAHHLRQKLAEKGHKLDAGQVQALSHACRAAKEQLGADPARTAAPVTVLGRGSRVIGGSLKTELTRADLDQVLLEGFFPACPPDAVPRKAAAVGLQELGLPYAADPVLTHHLAHFLRRHANALPKGVPTAVLFNGGVFKAPFLRDRLLAVLNGWARDAGAPPLRVLEGPDLDLAVARGAAYYGLVRRGRGVRIRGGAARSYYVGVETALPAVPGVPPPIKAVCVAPFGMEEGTTVEVGGLEVGLVVGEPARFRFLSSTVRQDDAVGTVLEDWEAGELEELSPLEVTLSAPDQTAGLTVPVRLRTELTPVGTLEVWCHGRDQRQQWKLEFNVRQD